MKVATMVGFAVLATVYPNDTNRLLTLALYMTTAFDFMQ